VSGLDSLSRGAVVSGALSIPGASWLTHYRVQVSLHRITAQQMLRLSLRARQRDADVCVATKRSENSLWVADRAA
jgi:hypothetical protein